MSAAKPGMVGTPPLHTVEQAHPLTAALLQAHPPPFQLRKMHCVCGRWLGFGEHRSRVPNADEAADPHLGRLADLWRTVAADHPLLLGRPRDAAEVGPWEAIVATRVPTWGAGNVAPRCGMPDCAPSATGAVAPSSCRTLLLSFDAAADTTLAGDGILLAETPLPCLTFDEAAAVATPVPLPAVHETAAPAAEGPAGGDVRSWQRANSWFKQRAAEFRRRYVSTVRLPGQPGTGGPLARRRRSGGGRLPALMGPAAAARSSEAAPTKGEEEEGGLPRGLLAPSLSVLPFFLGRHDDSFSITPAPMAHALPSTAKAPMADSCAVDLPKKGITPGGSAALARRQRKVKVEPPAAGIAAPQKRTVKAVPRGRRSAPTPPVGGKADESVGVDESAATQSSPTSTATSSAQSTSGSEGTDSTDDSDESSTTTTTTTGTTSTADTSRTISLRGGRGRRSDVSARRRTATVKPAARVKPPAPMPRGARRQRTADKESVDSAPLPKSTQPAAKPRKRGRDDLPTAVSEPPAAPTPAEEPYDPRSSAGQPPPFHHANHWRELMAGGGGGLSLQRWLIHHCPRLRWLTCDACGKWRALPPRSRVTAATAAGGGWTCRQIHLACATPAVDQEFEQLSTGRRGGQDASGIVNAPSPSA